MSEGLFVELLADDCLLLVVFHRLLLFRLIDFLDLVLLALLLLLGLVLDLLQSKVSSCNIG